MKVMKAWPSRVDRNDDVISGEDQVLLRPDFNALTFVTLWFKNVKSASSFELGVDLRPSWVLGPDIERVEICRQQ
ncbi:hypothetical protein F2Q68_00039009 [Brassica cretica]|uniref:Uncharacterized protein n=1 Tax=Brassica cretica TaxID=69181 RepID=A0A8S9MCQ6_BRACR|nr:hypothetical protein F2Q68_00039009 [Brassica cretica]